MHIRTMFSYALGFTATLLAVQQDGVLLPPPLPVTPGVSKPLVPITLPKPLVAALRMTDSAATSAPAVVMKLLVLAGDSSEIAYQGITTFLSEIGVPYQAVVLDTIPADANGDRLAAFALSDAATGRGLYQGVILTDSSFGVCDPTCHSRLSTADWTKLANYESQFQVRVLSYFTWPAPEWGLLPADSGADYTDANPLNMSFTAAAASIFPYLTRAGTIPVGGTIWAYRATTTAAANETTTAILTAGSYTVGATHTTADGRETFAVTMDNGVSLLHSMALNYGLINWVTKGVFLGSRQIYVSPQLDDMLVGDKLYAPMRPECPQDRTCPAVRAEGSDLQALSTWQTNKQLDTQLQAFRTTSVYCGIGAADAPPNDTLVPAVTALGSRFGWVSHTYSHSNLDCYTLTNGLCTPATSAQSFAEIDQNVAAATSLGITIDANSLVTPFNGGMSNSVFLQAAATRGIGFLGANPYAPTNPNTGIVNPYVPSILEIPRRPNHVFSDTNSPYSGVVGSLPDEYNSFFGPQGSQPTFDHNLTYSEILDNESQFLLADVLHYEAFPFSFHQSNMTIYDGTHSLFSDVMDATITRYKALCALPVKSMGMSDIGRLLARRASYNASGVTGIYTPGVSVVLTTVNAATIPVTGACSQLSCPTFGGQIQDDVSMAANSTVTLSLSAGQGVGLSSVTLNPTTVAGGSPTQGTVTLNGSAATNVVVSLSSDKTAATVPASVTVTAGNSSATFTVTTTAVTTSTTATITATYNSVSKTAPLTVTPVVALSGVSLNPTSVAGGSPSTGTVTLTGAAPTGGIVVSLSSNRTAAIVPATVTVTAGNSKATFTVATTAVATSTVATITATYTSVSKTASLTITPAALLSSLSLNPTSVAGGNSSTGTVTLSGPAPTGGVSISLNSNNSFIASVPASITIPGGSATGSFTVSTRSFLTTWRVTITASYGGTSRNSTLTVTRQ
jgi:hypothetical protein